MGEHTRTESRRHDGRPGSLGELIQPQFRRGSAQNAERIEGASKEVPHDEGPKTSSREVASTSATPRGEPGGDMELFGRLRRAI